MVDHLATADGANGDTMAYHSFKDVEIYILVVSLGGYFSKNKNYKSKHGCHSTILVANEN